MERVERDNSWNYKGCIYLKRAETNGIHLEFTPEDMPAYEFGRERVGEGWLNTGYHYIIHPDGEIEKGIPEEQYADPSILDSRDCICILVMGVPPEGIAYWKKRIWPFAAKRLSIKLPLKD